MSETFNLPLKVGASGSEKLSVNKVQFGDGYESRTSNGLNNQTSEWSVSITGDNEKLIPYIEFLANHGGVRSFYWTPPSGGNGLFTAEEWKTDTLGAGIYTLSTTFTRVYSAGPIETRAVEIIEGGGALIDDTKPSLASTYSSSKTEGVIKEITDTAIGALKKEDDPFTQYAKQKDLESAKTTADAAATQKELKNTNDRIANLEKVKPILSVNGEEPDETGNIAVDIASEINDTTTAKGSTWSSKQISDNVDEKLKDFKELPEKVAALEKEKFTIIYPNGGTKETPANVAPINCYILDNPFPNNPVIVIAEILVNGVWGDPNFNYVYNGGDGVKASHLLESDSIVVQVGNRGVLTNYSGYSGNSFNIKVDGVTATAPCRVKVWRI